MPAVTHTRGKNSRKLLKHNIVNIRDANRPTFHNRVINTWNKNEDSIGLLCWLLVFLASKDDYLHLCVMLVMIIFSLSSFFIFLFTCVLFACKIVLCLSGFSASVIVETLPSLVSLSGRHFVFFLVLFLCCFVSVLTNKFIQIG